MGYRELTVFATDTFDIKEGSELREDNEKGCEWSYWHRHLNMKIMLYAYK